MVSRSRSVLLAILPLALLSACAPSAEDELQQWMVSERNSIRPSVTPIEPPARFDPEAYVGERDQPPFDPEKLTSVLRGSLPPTLTNSALIEAELSRRKQPLEAYPLDTMVMVGSLMREGQLVALVKVDKLLYQVRKGNYLGQNYGRVNDITETEIVLREIVQDGAGDWIERPAALQLQEEGTR
ncbi:MAG: pilus assembly protein PilP [Burkholderiales bacterium]|nr:MAG: pilus assembly protein PilP [Burkholderiales bacterium]